MLDAGCGVEEVTVASDLPAVVLSLCTISNLDIRASGEYSTWSTHRIVFGKVASTEVSEESATGSWLVTATTTTVVVGAAA